VHYDRNVKLVEAVMATVKTLAKGQIVIPADLRKKYHIEPGKELHLMEYGDVMYLIPPADDPIAAATGILPEGPSLSRELLEERKKDAR
jgi:AbrB family looped-hinge helix DNA binding protein